MILLKSLVVANYNVNNVKAVILGYDSILTLGAPGQGT